MGDADVGVEAAVKMMNDLRVKHGAGPMVLDNSQQQKAKQSAKMICQTGAFNHQGKAATSLYGESGYRPTGDALTRAVMSWYSEEPLYTQYYDNPPFSGSAAGHFTDLVWKANTNVALVTGDDSGQRVSNMGGQYGQNVGRPTGQS